MAFHIRRADYFYTTVDDEPAEAHKVLSLLAELGVNLLAFTAVPLASNRTQFTMFPEDSAQIAEVARQAGLSLDGPHRALLVQGDDELGALAGIHDKLYQADVHVFASAGVSDGRGLYGYILYVRPDEYERAVTALEV
jgi:hypothetical protein